jgi:TolA-binding protein
MAQKLGFFSQWMFGDWAERDAINKNADTLETIEAKVSDLRSTVARQAQEITRLRAMVMGLVGVLQTKISLDDAELESAVNAAWAQLVPPPRAPQPQAPSDPYRNLPSAGEPTPEDIEAAKRLLRVAEDHHFSKRFADARAVYQEIVDRYDTTKQASVARQQLDNLRGQ